MAGSWPPRDSTRKGVDHRVEGDAIAPLDVLRPATPGAALPTTATTPPPAVRPNPTSVRPPALHPIAPPSRANEPARLATNPEDAPTTLTETPPSTQLLRPAPAPVFIVRARSVSAPAPRADHVLPTPLDLRFVLVNEPNSARAESFRLLRENLIAKKVPRVLAVTSARPREGKTTCALNLALALAEQQPTSVLLLDANVFEPCFGELFGIDEHDPNVEYTMWLAPYRVLQVSAGLHVAALLRTGTGPAPRVDTRRFPDLFTRASRAGYDHVIVDTPALADSPSVSQLVGAADAALITVRSGTTTTHAVRSALQMVPDRQSIGLVIMDAAPLAR